MSMCFHKVQSLMDACINVYCTNAIYKHIHHGEYIHMYIILFKSFLLTIFFLKLKIVSRCVNLSLIFFLLCDSTSKKRGKNNYIIMWYIMPCHVNLGPHISMS
jgi:hypothetical protein